MRIDSKNPVDATKPVDHRVLSARRKRESMRIRILEATMHVFARVNDAPVIEDVVREARIARGSFYKHFDSLDQAVVAAGAEANDRMITELLPVYDFLKEPWQRIAVGFRVYLIRAQRDPKWAAFMTRIEAWSVESLITRYMSSDLRKGRESGQFEIDDVDVAADFIKGASASTISAVRLGVADPDRYMDQAVGMLLRAVGCSPELRGRAVLFSRKHLSDWECGERSW